MQEEKFFRLPIIRFFRKRYLKKYDEFMKNNRPEVLLMYREFLKTIPKLYTRKLIIQAKIEVFFYWKLRIFFFFKKNKECKFIFREARNEPFIDNIKYNKEIGYYGKLRIFMKIIVFF